MSVYATFTYMERFWNKVDKSGDCWIWTGAKYYNGYGCFNFGTRNPRRNIGAHRMAYILEYGEIPEGHNVLHKCDNHPCVRPSHLFTGTQSINTLDMIQKRRMSTKLTYEDVQDIRALHKKRIALRKEIAGLSDQKLATHFGVSTGVIRKITGGSVWNPKTWEKIQATSTDL